jgi:hypothetical protein
VTDNGNFKELRKEFEECKTRLLEYSPNSLEVYREYKGIFSKNEWEKEKAVILEKLKKTYCDIKVYYAEEKMIRELFEEVRSSPTLYGLDEYEKVLFDDYSNELLELFVKRVIKRAEHTGQNNCNVVGLEVNPFMNFVIYYGC